MAWTRTRAQFGGNRPMVPVSNMPTWQPEPQKPSTPWVPDEAISTFEASPGAGPSLATSVVRSLPSGCRALGLR